MGKSVLRTAVVVGAVIGITGMAACGTPHHHTSYACASTASAEIALPNDVQATPRPVVRRSSSAPYHSTSGSHATSVPVVRQTSSRVPAPPSSQQRRSVPGERAYTPPANVRQPQADINLVRRHMPTRLSTSSHDHYVSPVTHHVYMYHDTGYFGHLGWHDPYDPYDPYNWHNPYSPFYGAHFRMVSHC